MFCHEFKYLEEFILFKGKMPSAAGVSLTELQDDWDNRELVEVVQLNILKMVDFLNKFDLSVRYRLSKITERITTLERSLQYCESSIIVSKQHIENNAA